MSRDDTARKDGPTEYQSNAETLLSDVKRLCLQNEMLQNTLRNIRDNWDCDEDAHKHGTTCRCCLAADVLEHLALEALARQLVESKGEAVETSNPVQAARWIGREVESDNPMDDEDRPSTYDEETDEITYMPVRETLDAVWQDGGWIGEVCVEWPIRLARPVETKEGEPT